MVYAALDGVPAIGLQHLKAALAVWEYCEASARYIFGDAIGDPVADRILKQLRQDSQGLTRTIINGALGRNIPAARIEQALELLLEAGLAKFEQRVTEGRPAEVWYAV